MLPLWVTVGDTEPVPVVDGDGVELPETLPLLVTVGDTEPVPDVVGDGELDADSDVVAETLGESVPEPDGEIVPVPDGETVSVPEVLPLMVALGDGELVGESVGDGDTEVVTEDVALDVALDVDEELPVEEEEELPVALRCWRARWPRVDRGVCGWSRWTMAFEPNQRRTRTSFSAWASGLVCPCIGARWRCRRALRWRRVRARLDIRRLPMSRRIAVHRWCSWRITRRISWRRC